MLSSAYFLYMVATAFLDENAPQLLACTALGLLNCSQLVVYGVRGRAPAAAVTTALRPCPPDWPGCCCLVGVAAEAVRMPFGF